eukprot:jgi/Psemu1/43315/gm1.43315_g
MKSVSTILVVAALVLVSEGFAPTPTTPSASRTTSTSTELCAEKEGGNPIFGAISNFFQELDAFVDDATARRLGNGAAYYGKRKSSFYGSNDSMKKQDKDVADSEEDYMVSSAGNYKWITDENGQMIPVSRMKNRNLEKPLEYWGRKDGKSEE